MSARLALPLGLLVALLSASLLAQQPPSPPPPQPPPGPTAEPLPEDKIAAALYKRVSCDVVETELHRVLDELGEKVGVRIHFDLKALADVGIGTDTPVTRMLADMPLKSILRHILRDLDLTYIIRDEVLLVTTPEEADAQMVTRIFPVKDLLEPDIASDGREGPRYDFDSLIDVIVSHLALAPWDGDNDGSMRGHGASLVVSQSAPTMEQVERILGQLRRGRELWKKWDGKSRLSALQPGAVLPGDDFPDEARIARVLQEATMIAAIEKPLSRVISDVAARHKINIQFDKKALADVGLGTDSPVTANAEGVTLAAALRRILRGLDLTYVIRDDALIITTPEESRTTFKLRAYPVFDLAEEWFGPRRSDNQAANVAGGAVGGGAAAIPTPPRPPEMLPRAASLDNWPTSDADAIIELITSTIQRAHWDGVGGPGSVDFYLPSRVLLISASGEAHAEIEALLAKLREMSPIARKMQPELFDEHERKVITLFFELRGDTPERPAPEAKELAELVRTAVSPEVWKTSGYSVTPLRGRLRVVAPRKTVRAVDSLLRAAQAIALEPVVQAPVRLPAAATPE